MSSSANLFPVQFHGQTLFVLSHNGQPFTPMKPIVEGMGMAWQSQHAKIKADAARWSVTNIVTVAEDGKRREVVCMPLRKLPGWLMTINPKKVSIGIRKTVILYQNECDDVLWDFWTKGEAVNKRKAIPDAQKTLKSRYWDWGAELHSQVYRAMRKFQGRINREICDTANAIMTRYPDTPERRSRMRVIQMAHSSINRTADAIDKELDVMIDFARGVEGVKDLSLR